MQQHPHNTRPRAGAQVADDANETDWEFFSSRPEAQTRTRSASDDEVDLFPDARGRSLIAIVMIVRDGDGQPLYRARGFYFAESGRA